MKNSLMPSKEDVEMQLSLAQSYLEMGEHDGAEEIYKKVIAQDPENNQAKVLLKQLMDEKVTIQQLLAYLIKNRGSDLHLRVGLPPMMRVSGDIRRFDLPTINESHHVQNMMQDLLGLDAFQRFVSGHQSRFLAKIENLAVFEVQLLHTNGQLSASIRVQPDRILTLDDLNAPDVFRRINTDIRRGLILINGKVGGGRTTTMAALRYEMLNTQNCHVVSLSSDAFTNQASIKEGLHSSMTVGLGNDVNSYDEALKCAEKIDPDYIFIFEPLDNLSTSEVRRIVTLARLGYMVVASIQEDSTDAALHHMLALLDYSDRKFAQLQLASVLKVSICQRLLRMKNEAGRVATHEILTVLPDVRMAIANFDLDKISRVLASHDESTSMKRAAKDLLNRGIIDAAEFDRV